MSTLGIVVLGIIGGLFIAILLALAGGLIYLFFKARTILAEFRENLAKDLGAIRAGLEAQQQQIVIAIQKLNGEQLSQAATQILASARQNTQAASRIERAALAIGELIIPAEVKQAAGLAPEEYAQPEPGESFVIPGRTARLDEEAEREEGRSVTEGF